MSAKMEINPDLSGTVSMEVDTTSEEEKQIEQYMNSQQGSTAKTYAEIMKEMEFTANGTKVLNGKEHNSYILSQKASAKEMKSSFLELTGDKAVMSIAQDSQKMCIRDRCRACAGAGRLLTGSQGLHSLQKTA